MAKIRPTSSFLLASSLLVLMIMSSPFALAARNVVDVDATKKISPNGGGVGDLGESKNFISYGGVGGATGIVGPSGGVGTFAGIGGGAGIGTVGGVFPIGGVIGGVGGGTGGAGGILPP